MTGQPAQATVTLGQEYIFATGTCLPEHLATVGGKAVGLGSLLRAGQREP